ncbi:MAG: bile acid:sodium symporter family protein [Saprospiraceae bacterium]|jgi:BASS family bile acid:Na+ symporter|nr:bile acid:sodium symporter family protein [Saprospiraceae bacterium]
MNNLDQININFDQGQITLLNICLGILMFGVALDIHFSEFTYIIKNPKSIIAGLISQWILLPVLTIVLIWIIKPEFALAMGMILIASSPGGNVSNYAVHLSGANAALSVMLTTISTLMCVFTTPIIFSFFSTLLSKGNTSYPVFEIQFLDMASSILQLIIIPMILAQICVQLFPVFTDKIKKMVRMLSLCIFIGFVLFAIKGNLDNLVEYIGIVFFIVLIHNGLALFLGYHFSRSLLGLPVQDARAISIETGIQNSGLALILIFNFFEGQGGMALIAAWWSIWHLISAFVIALIWSRKKMETK